MDERSPKQYVDELAKQLGLCTMCHRPLSRTDTAGTQVPTERFNLLQAELADACKQIAVLADFPQHLQWLTPFERMAYAAGIISDSDIVKHFDCDGHGKRDSPEGAGSVFSCTCQGRGVVISDEARARIKEAYPQYELLASHG